MLRMFARRLSQHLIANGTDRVTVGINLPSASVVHDIAVEMHVIGEGQFDHDLASMYSVGVWVIPITDPDAVVTHDTLLNQFVPKDSDSDVIDLDTVATDGAPFFEPGEPNLANLLDVGVQPRQLYRREKLMSVVSNAALRFPDSQTPFGNLYTPGDFFKIRLRRAVRVSQPSVILIGFASPAMDDNTTTVEAAPLEAEWPRMKYMRETLKQAMVTMFGLQETGGDQLYDTAITLLKKWLLPDFFEETASDLAATTYNVFTRAMFDFSVVGEVDVKSVSLS